MEYKPISSWTRRRKRKAGVTRHLENIQRSYEESQIESREGVVHFPEQPLNENERESNNLQDDQNIFYEIDLPDDLNIPDEIDHNPVPTISDSEDELASNDSDFSTSSDDSGEPSLSERLTDWAVAYNITHAALTALLLILQILDPRLPRTAKTLLGTMRNIVTKKLAGGSYYHFGIRESIISRLQKFTNMPTEISIQVNIDGLPLFKSSQGQFWPILGLLDNCEYKKPFIIGLYYGEKKPSSDKEYLREFIDEVKELEKEGFEFKRTFIPFSISAVICDTPARSFVKCTKGHGGYGGCDQCSQYGVYCGGKVTYPETQAPARTDEDFRAMIDEDHHLESSPSIFTELNIGMVTQFPVDYMHLVCLGVVKRLIGMWTKGPLPTRLGWQTISEISARLLNIRNEVPVEFARKPRSMKDLCFWKATEYRQFLLYTGPICLDGLLPKPFFDSFMLLSVAMRMLLSPSQTSRYCDYAHELLLLFVKHFGQLYGEQWLVYNVHGLVHLADQAKRYGPLDNISAFVFENHLGKIKKMVKRPYKPLEQVVCRLSEREEKFEPIDIKILKGEHCSGPLPRNCDICTQFKELNLGKYCIKISSGDNCVTADGEILLVRNIIKKCSNKEPFIVYEKALLKEKLFLYPVDSTSLGIFKVVGLSGVLNLMQANKISSKNLIVPFNDAHVVIPLLH